MPPTDSYEIGSVKALLDDARARIKESEDRCNEKIKEAEARIQIRLNEIETLTEKNNLKLIEWLPLLTNLTKTEENKRNVVLLMTVSIISNLAAWVFTAFVYYIKSGGDIAK